MRGRGTDAARAACPPEEESEPPMIATIPDRRRGPKTRPRRRKRLDRSQAPWPQALERRALPAAVAPPALIATPTGAQATTPEPAPPDLLALPFAAAATVPTPGPSPWRPDRGGEVGGTGGAVGPLPTSGPFAGDRRVDMAVTTVDVDGQPTPEFAWADPARDVVKVQLGWGPGAQRYAVTEGISGPQAVVLADLNGNNIPDLIVANTGDNNVLVFPGLPGGMFGPEVEGGRGFAVGQEPVGISVDATAGHDDLVVADKGSNQVTILDGQGVAGGWTATGSATIATGQAPVKALVVDVNGDGKPDLLVCNSGSDSVSVYDGEGDGQFSPTPSSTFATGVDPTDLFVDRFDRRPELDLVTVDSGSNDLTFVGGVFTPMPSTLTISTAGVGPDAAFPVDPTNSGIMDLVVANGGDGRVAIFQPANVGMQLAGVVTQEGLPAPTALAPGPSSGNGLELYAATAGEDAAELLRFDLGSASTYLAAPLANPSAISEADSELFAQLVPGGDSSLSTIAVLWSGNPDPSSPAGDGNSREPATVTAFYSPTEGQGDDSPNGAGPAPAPESSREAPPSAPDGPPGPATSSLVRFVAGLDRALDRPPAPVEAVAASDLPEPGDGRRPVEDIARGFDPRAEATDASIEELLRALDSGDYSRPGEVDPAATSGPPPASTPAPGGDERREGDREGRSGAVPLVSSALVISARLILKAATPRPPGFRKPVGRRIPATS